MDLSPSIAALLQQLGPLALMVVVVGAFVRRGARRRVQAQLGANEQAAAHRGMAYQGPEASAVDSDEGVHRYEGTTRGVAWTAEVLVLAGQHHVDPDRTPMGRTPYTRWTAAACGTAGGGCLALLNLPPGVLASPSPPVGRGGALLHSLQDRAGALALRAWLRLSFGGDRIGELQIDPAQAQPLAPIADARGALGMPFGDEAAAAGFEHAFAAYGAPELLPRLTASARAWLMRAQARKLSLLWDARGLTLFWPAGAATPEHVQACAEYGVELVRRLHARADGQGP